MVLGGVLIDRVVAASDMPAGQADAQVHPGVTKLQALSATWRAGDDVLDLVKMRAIFLGELSIRQELVDSLPGEHFFRIIHVHV